MGISFSNNRRRNNTYYQPHPPSHYSSSDPISLPIQPRPPPPPPPQPPPLPLPPQNYFTAVTTSTAPPHTSYGAPPIPPIHSYYGSHPYSSCAYDNRFSYQPYYYANQASGWPAIRPSVGPTGQPVEPAPYIEHQNAKKVRNDVNVHKDTLRVEFDEHNPDNYLVSFVFDALFDGSILIFYFAKEEANCRFVPLFPKAHLPVRIPFQKGLGQKFRQPLGTGIDLGFFELDELSKPSPGEDVFPLVIVAETCTPVHSADEHVDVDDSVPNTSSHMQITQAVLEKKNNDPFQVRVVRQILWIDGVRYELRELYGIGNSVAEGFNDSDPGKECVICMTEPKDTAVLPCRHMCMCSECAKELRLQSNKCPVCRQPIEELIEIKINNGDQ